MELLLVRHALPLRAAAPDGGRADPALASDGSEQARHLATYLAAERVDAIYSSPQRRAIDTVRPLSDRLALEIGVIDGIAEWDREASEYVPVEELKASGDPRFADVTRETWRDMTIVAPFRDRVVDAVEDVIARHSGHRVVLACHAGVINVFLGEVLGLPLERRGFIYPEYTSIHRVVAARSGERSIVSINETAHLRLAGLATGGLRKAIR